MNNIQLVGQISSDIKLNHYINNNDYYEFIIATKRLSLIDDLLTVVALGKMIRENELTKGDFVNIEGEIKTYNCNGHVKVYIHPYKIEKTEEPYFDEVVLVGKICKQPINRITPLGTEITDIILTVTDKLEQFNYIPVVIWNSNARKCSNYKRGDTIYVKGRLQSREYTKNEETKTAIELSAKEIGRV